jgi:ASC-1-like (ASCH) protein
MTTVQNEAFSLFQKKNKDYGDAFAKYGPVGVLMRMGDKISRLQSITKTGIVLVNDEKIRDTLIDLHNYSAMCVMLLDEGTEIKINDEVSLDEETENENENELKSESEIKHKRYRKQKQKCTCGCGFTLESEDETESVPETETTSECNCEYFNDLLELKRREIEIERERENEIEHNLNMKHEKEFDFLSTVIEKVLIAGMFCLIVNVGIHLI